MIGMKWACALSPVDMSLVLASLNNGFTGPPPIVRDTKALALVQAILI
jgi:hypothetical protein